MVFVQPEVSFGTSSERTKPALAFRMMQWDIRVSPV